MEQTVRKAKYRNPIADHPDQILFFIFFLLGSASIWLVKSVGGDTARSQTVATAIPLTLMLLYAGISLATKRYRLREDKIGDNIYYLGFLFTLTSLAYALFVYNPDGSGATQIITNFGIAIFTTIIGLAGRVLFNQMREDPVEYEREARYSLAEASAALRSQLADVSTEMSSFKRKIVQITEEGVLDVSNSAKASLSDNVNKFAETANEVISSIKSAFGTFVDHADKLNNIASNNVLALEALFQRIERIEASPDLLSTKLDPVIRKFAEVADEAAKRNRGQASDLKKVRDSIEVAIKAADELFGSVLRTQKASSQKVDNFNSSIEAASAAAANLVTTLDQSSQSVGSALQNVKSVSVLVAEQVGQSKEMIEKLFLQIDSDLAAVKAQRESIVAMADESRAAVQTVQASLVSLASTMVEELRVR